MIKNIESHEGGGGGEEKGVILNDCLCLQEDVSENDVDAYIVVFSVNDRSTFEMALEMLFQIRHELCSEKAVILVANKIDIVRKRVISSDGTPLAGTPNILLSFMDKLLEIVALLIARCFNPCVMRFPTDTKISHYLPFVTQLLTMQLNNYYICSVKSNNYQSF